MRLRCPKLVRFPKYVTLENQRLALLFYSLLLGMVILVVLWLSVTAPWNLTEDVRQHTAASLWVQPESGSNAETAASVMHQCGKSLLVSHNQSCAPLCKTAGQDPGCQWPEETHFRHGDDELFLVTHVQDILMTPGATSDNKVRNQYVPLIDARQIGLVYYVDVPLRAWHGEEGPGYETYAPRDTAFSAVDLATKVLDHEGTHIRTQKPSPAIQLSVQELLELAGQQGQLDAPNCHALLEDAGQTVQLTQSDCPLGRFTGIELVLHVDCFGSGRYRECLLGVRRTPRSWVSERRVYPTAEGGLRLRHYHGIRVKFQGGGHTRSFKVTMLMETITSAWVFFNLPHQAILLFCMFCLGHLSVIYKQVLCSNFTMEEAMGGMAMRLIVVHNAFLQLQDKQGISESLLGRLLLEVFSGNHELDNSEVARLAHYCFMAANCAPSASGVPLDFIADGGCSAGTLDTNRQIDGNLFNAACTSNEPLNFASVIKLFDVDRHRSLLERWFTEPGLARTLAAQWHFQRSSTSSSSMQSWRQKIQRPRRTATRSENVGQADEPFSPEQIHKQADTSSKPSSMPPKQIHKQQDKVSSDASPGWNPFKQADETLSEELSTSPKQACKQDKSQQSPRASPIVSMTSPGFPAVSSPATKPEQEGFNSLQWQPQANVRSHQSKRLDEGDLGDIGALFEEPLNREMQDSSLMLGILRSLQRGFDELERRVERLEIKHMEEELMDWSHDGPCPPSGEAISRTVGDGSAQEEKPSAMAIRHSAKCQHVQRLRCNALQPPKESTSHEMTLPETTSLPLPTAMA